MPGSRPRPGAVEDLSSLSDLDEATLLEELKVRYTQNKIYTYVGDILVALNPFKSLEMYSQEHRKRYRNAQRWQNHPHIFAVADSAYQQMCATERNQCCVISGESGAGKTESAKLIVSQLMELSQSRSLLEQRILQANPLLEAFGNARTSMNDNSSRFGKYLQLKFKNKRVTGAKINEYLLEKSRLVSQAPQEQNFHIFYYLFTGLDSTRRAELGLTDPSHFHYLQKRTSGFPASDEHYRFSEVCDALDLVGFESSYQEDIFTCLSALLHLGNVEFFEDSNEYSHILDPRTGPVQKASELLGVEVHYLVSVLTISLSYTRGEAIQRHLNKQGSLAARDAMAKALYDRVFRWIVNRVNQLLAPTAVELVGETEIGILDIFGFEKFERNGFEQMCINVANERLQYFFVEHVFLLAEEEYRKEGLGSLNIQIGDNKPLLDLFLSKPLGLYALLDEQCNFPRADDRAFISKLSQVMKKKKSSLFVPSKNTASCCFSIVHYAGKVEYNSVGFLDKNRDSLPSGGMELLRTSDNDLIKLIFTANVTRTGTLALNRLTTQRLKKKGKRSVPMATSKPLTIGAQFKNSLLVLMEKMKAAVPHFVKCIKPNTEKSPDNFNPETVLTQLRYTGMLETVRIRREGYPYRPPFQEFIDRYGILADLRRAKSLPESCGLILSRVGMEGYQIGKTRVFLKHYQRERLSSEMQRVHRAAVLLQKIARGFVKRAAFLLMVEVKRQQEAALGDFLLSISSNSDYLFLTQLALCEMDLESPPPSAPPRGLLPAPPPPSAPPIDVLTQQVPIRHLSFGPKLPPPPDHTIPPPEPTFSDLDEVDGDDGCHGDVAGTNEMEHVFVSLTPRADTFGRPGTKLAVLRWFEETQAPGLCSSSTATGHFPDWFYRNVTRREAQDRLMSESPGTFLLRVCENRFGFSLSLKTGRGCVLHLVISQLETGKYVLVGSPKVHSSLPSLIHFYSKTPINPVGDILSRPYGKIRSTGDNTTPPAPGAGTPPTSPRVLEESRNGRKFEGVARSKPKLSRTRSHDPQMGYGGMISKKSQNY